MSRVWAVVVAKPSSEMFGSRRMAIDVLEK